MTTQVLMVCLGNICRSPTAHGVFQQHVDAANLADQIDVDSAGTGGWHTGSAPHVRATATAKKRGYDLSQLMARQVTTEDFARFDYVLAMDNDNLYELQRLAPADYHGHLSLFLDFGNQTRYLEVPDPYYGGDKGFELVLDLVEDASEGLLAHIRHTRYI